MYGKLKMYGNLFRVISRVKLCKRIKIYKNRTRIGHFDFVSQYSVGQCEARFMRIHVESHARLNTKLYY